MSSSTRPVDAWRPRVMHAEEFGRVMDQALCNYYPPRHESHLRRPYHRMRVLIVLWEGDIQSDGSGIGNQARRVYELFDQVFKYIVEPLVLKTTDRNPEATLERKLHQMLDDLEDNDLAVIYYIGHGNQVSSPGDQSLHFHLTTPGDLSRKHPNQSLDFHALRANIINTSAADVLILLDCGATAGGAIGPRKELIAASAFNQTASINTGPTSFTSVLVEQLSDAVTHNRILSTAQLYKAMATRLMVSLEETPYFLQNCGENRLPIMLAPNIIGTDTWTLEPSLHLFQQPVNAILHVCLEHLQVTNHQTLDRWRLELLLVSCRPNHMSRIEIQSVSQGFSVVNMTFKTTLDVWYSLPNNTAISFIGFVWNDIPEPETISPTEKAVENLPGERNDLFNNKLFGNQPETCPLFAPKRVQGGSMKG
ncbi:hypothetical protein NM208_g12991 [Fusarium decemcellulare]|uniref:Uncharacterized protein n=1 Tax=Fusarium decemcellulare TaxID=57161 RepID=A0ACC1RM54_9HYPO|nr:hypothetical protein NM208_g12991 [Fusarium decemcellulare]